MGGQVPRCIIHTLFYLDVGREFLESQIIPSFPPLLVIFMCLYTVVWKFRLFEKTFSSEHQICPLILSEDTFTLDLLLLLHRVSLHFL